MQFQRNHILQKFVMNENILDAENWDIYVCNMTCWAMDQISDEKIDQYVTECVYEQQLINS